MGLPEILIIIACVAVVVGTITMRIINKKKNKSSSCEYCSCCSECEHHCNKK